MTIVYAREEGLGPDEFVDVLRRSGLDARRPVGDQARVERMLTHANLIVTARDHGRLIGVSRALSDFAFCCYLSDLAVDRDHQGRGIGRQLIEETRKAAGPDSMCLLLSAPDAIGFYQAIGMPKSDRAFMYDRSR